MFYAACIQNAAQIAPKTLVATSQGLFSAIYNGLGSGIGAYIGGTALDSIGPVIMFRVQAAVVMGAMILYWAHETIMDSAATTSNATPGRRKSMMERLMGR